jgi:arginyl-tRNA synthetase
MPTEALRAQLARNAGELAGSDDVPVQLDRPRNPEHGDIASNLAMLLAKRVGQPPRAIAEQIIARLDLDAAGVRSAEVAGPGFINFRLAQASLSAKLVEVVDADETYGRSTSGGGKRVQVEFVSANPTGPLHVAHGRGAAIGDGISSLLEWTGWNVTREFYVNDAGVQIDRLAESIEARWLTLNGTETPIPENGYHGEYVIELAQQLERERGDELRAMDRPARLKVMRDFGVRVMGEEHDRDLREFGVVFDTYFRESSLYEEDRLTETLNDLASHGLTYEQDGAVWLRTTAFGDDKDRVLVKSDGTYTYFLPDLAYHREKAKRFDYVINVWGADHHGYVPRMKAALAALGHPDLLDVEIVQMVRIVRGGEEVKLSKRAGNIVTLRDLFTETGVDVARYFFLMRRADAQMLFDLDLALDQSEKNPVYKVQYAHARMMSIFRKAGVDPGALRVEASQLDRLTDPSEQELIKQLAEFPSVVQRAADARAPHLLCDYLEATASLVNSWYHAGNPSRNPALAVLVDDDELRAARLVLARGVRTVLRNGLHILGLNAPDRMDREENAA